LPQLIKILTFDPKSYFVQNIRASPTTDAELPFATGRLKYAPAPLPAARHVVIRMSAQTQTRLKYAPWMRRCGRCAVPHCDHVLPPRARLAASARHVSAHLFGGPRFRVCAAYVSVMPSMALCPARARPLTGDRHRPSHRPHLPTTAAACLHSHSHDHASPRHHREEEERIRGI
jgi:hypothetical protein